MALLHRKRVMAAKIETAAGTAETLAATDGVFNVEEVDVQPDIPMVERPAQNSLSALSSVPGARKGKLTFSIYAIGGSIVPAWASTFLPACGWKATGNVYALTSTFSDYKTLTMGVYSDGVYHLITGAMGNMQVEGENGKPLKLKFEFSGVWQPVTDLANIAPTYPTTVPPRLASATLAIGSFSPTISKLTLNQGNTITVLESVNTVSGYSFAVVTNRKVEGNLDSEAVTIATTDVWGQWLSGAEAALSFSVGATGNKIAFAAPKCQYKGLKMGNRGDIVTTDLDFQCNKSTAAGDDEVSITFA